MKNGISTDRLPDKCYVVQIDGRVKSAHRRFVNALREALHLRNEFPEHEVRVRAREVSVDHHGVAEGLL